MLDIIVNNFWAIAAAILGSAFVGYITWRNNHKGRIAAASAKFRATLLQAFIGIYPSRVEWPANNAAVDAHLRRIFPALQLAVAEFRLFIPWWRRRAFDKAWFRYRGSTGREIDTQAYEHYMDFSGQPEPKVTFHANVSKLLSFANKT